MKVLMITATFSPSVNGVSISVATTYQNLKSLGHEVTVLAPQHPDSEENGEKDIIRYPAAPNPLAKDYPIPLVPLNISKLKDQEFDIVHAHQPYHISYFAKLFADYYKAPLVITYHTRYPEFTQEYLSKLPKKITKEIVQTSVFNTLKETDLIVTPSRFIEEELRNSMPYLNYISIPTGFFLPRDNISDKSKGLLKKYKQFDNKTIILNVARLSKEKNHKLLIKSMNYLPEDFILLLVGDGPYREKLEKIVGIYGLETRVHFLGSIAHKELIYFYELANIFAAPSYMETQGMTLLEAQSCGLPIVGVNSEINVEWIPKFSGSTVGNGEKGFAEALIKCRNNYDSFEKNKIIKYAQEYTIENTAKKVLQAYEKTIEARIETKQLTKTGWQSWSTDTKRFFKIPAYNYPPKKDKSTILAPAKIHEQNDRTNISGWCSWYAFGKKINHKKICEQAKFISKNKLPLEYILIDDGWCQWGNWEKPYTLRFPEGLTAIVEDIEAQNLKAGIWLAPFLVDKTSSLMRTRPEWVVKYGAKAVNGYILTKNFNWMFPYKKYIVDIRNTELTTYLHNTINYLLRTHGFKLLKLDFLYAVYFIPDIHPKEATWLLNNFLHQIKKDNPQVYVTACGCPFVPAVGVVDAMRIGPDTIKPHLDRLPLFNYVNIHGLKEASRIIVARTDMKKYWHLDPDVFVCRPSLKIPDEVLLTHQKAIKQVNGNVFLGDDLTVLSRERLKKFVYPLIDAQ